jgi:hypothetical protein
MATKFRRIDGATKRILSVKVNRDVDDQPDLSHLGEYSNKPGDADKTIDRGERSRECRYFIATLSGDETGNPDSVRQDYERMEAYNNQKWCMIGISASADVVLAGQTVQRIRSAGLWGVESDSDGAYLAEVESEQLDELREQLEALGFSTIEIDAAFSSAKRD